MYVFVLVSLLQGDKKLISCYRFGGTHGEPNEFVNRVASHGVSPLKY